VGEEKKKGHRDEKGIKEESFSDQSSIFIPKRTKENFDKKSSNTIVGTFW
jgi:hypothetical protein